MKKQLACLMTLGLLSGMTSVSEAEASVSLKVFGGVNYTRADLIDEDGGSLDADSLIGLGGGIGTEFHLNETFGIGLDVLYIQKKLGAEINDEFEISVQTNYLMVPLLLRVSPIEMLTFGLGGYFAYGIGETSITVNDVTITDDIDDDAQTDYGLTVALGAKFPLSDQIGIFLEGRYNMGLKDMDNSVQDIQGFVGLSYRF
jgi:opacity protein-like surface antigen